MSEPDNIPPDEMRAALKWALETGVKATASGPSGFYSRGCGCCSYDLEPPKEIDALVRSIRHELIEEKKIS